MEENIVKFEEKLKDLVSLGKKKKSILEVQEINDFFSDMSLVVTQMKQVILFSGTQLTSYNSLPDS